MKKNGFVLILLLLINLAVRGQVRPHSLAGIWQYRLDSLDQGSNKKWYLQKLSSPISLPGTLDDAGIGKAVKFDTTKLTKDVMLHLSRKHRYVGAVWYQRIFTLESKMENAQLYLERALWKTDCWIDGKPAGTQESLIAPQLFDLGKLKAGRHVITIRIDNRNQHDISVNEFAHAYTDGTQIIWNGVIGKILLTDQGKKYIKETNVYASLANRTVRVVSRFSDVENVSGYTRLTVLYGNKVLTQTKHTRIEHNLQEMTFRVADAQPWDEFHPRIYTLRLELTNARGQLVDTKTESFGFRDLGTKGGELMLNGKPLFLRGTLECNIFPLKGHPPMEKTGWVKVFETAKAYGLNHLRFHSWCPPEAAFQVADSLGFYLHVELPLWSLTVGKDPKTLTYLDDESRRIISNYGNHPSFCFWSMGNELEGDFAWLESLVRKLKGIDNRHLYTTTTFSFQKGHGKIPEPADDYFITQYTGKGWVRGQGIFNSDLPNFKTDYSKAVAGLDVPLIIHEVGQYSVYPDLQEISKYTGVLRPANFETVRHDLRRKQMLSLAPEYLKASGALAVQLYKEEIERALKTKGVCGFQLLDLHDFPGQGTALVGLLNAFWDSKGLIRPAEFREFCGPVVPLIRFEKAAYNTTEHFVATAEIANYSDHLINDEIVWSVKSADGEVDIKGTLGDKEIAIGNSQNAGQFTVDLSTIDRARELNVSISMVRSQYTNHWKIWVYPAKLPELNPKVTFTTNIDSALSLLKEGKTVILNPDTSAIKGIDGRFAPVFWSPVHFPDQPGSMGLLIDTNNRALSNFPTKFYSDWQWWDLVTNSRSIVLDGIGLKTTPIIRVIDNFFKNRNLTTLLELKLGKGKLVLCTMDVHHNLSDRPAARQLRYSLLEYAASDDFHPLTEIDEQDLKELLIKP